MSRMNIRTKETRFPVASDLYGLFLKISAGQATADFILRCFGTGPSRIP